MSVEGTVNSRVSGGIQKFFQAFINQENLEHPPTRVKVLKLYEELKNLSNTVSDSIKMLQKMNAPEGRLQVLESAYRDF
jgi:hypothetical protein